MSEELKEDVRVKMSAFMDGEAGNFEARRTLKEIAADAELKRKWYRYQLASSAMRDELPGKMVDLSAGIRSAIDTEARPRQSLLAGPVGRVVVAASVAVFTVLGVQYIAPLAGFDVSGIRTSVQQRVAGFSETDAGGVSSVDSDREFPETRQFLLPRGFDVPQVRARAVSADSVVHKADSRYATGVAETAAEAQLRQFQERAIRAYIEDRMLRHTERISLSSHQGMLPFARIPQNLDESENSQFQK